MPVCGHIHSGVWCDHWDEKKTITIAIFPTTTKEKTRPAGLETLEQVKAQSSVPVVAIGGIGGDSVARVMQAGADAACVISAVIGGPNPEEAARRFVEAMSRLPSN